MGRRLFPVLAGALTVAILFVGSADASRWSGTATNLKGDFRFGKVTFTVKGGYIRNLRIRAVTCSSTIVPFTTIVVPKAKIKGKTFYGKYVPVPGINDAIKVGGTISGSVARGTFREGPLITCEGRFKAIKG